MVVTQSSWACSPVAVAPSLVATHLGVQDSVHNLSPATAGACNIPREAVCGADVAALVTAGLTVARRFAAHRRRRYTLPGCSSHRRCLAAGSESGIGGSDRQGQERVPSDFQISIIESLQGTWEDDVGNTIEVQGNEANFNDGSSLWKLQEFDDGSVGLRGTKFVGSLEEPKWRFPNGIERVWLRPPVVTPEQEAWARVFHGYKTARLLLRRRWHAAVISEDFAQAAEVREAWQSGGQAPENTSLEQQARLAAGRLLVPGICFVHRRYNYRGVVIGCEPWCQATAAWKTMMGVAGLPRGDRQPFYHCLVDVRDRPGGQITFVGEENVEPREEAFPVEHPLSGRLLAPCEELQSYLPSPLLDEVLQQQREDGKFRL